MHLECLNQGKEVKLFGLTMRIENPAGSIRKGVDPNGKKWSTKMPCDYGKIIGTKGTDGESVDCFIGPNKDAKNVYVIKLSEKVSDGEDKVMLGFKSSKAAMNCFAKAYDDPKKFFDGMSKMSLKAFKKQLVTRRGKHISAMMSPFGGFFFDYASFDIAPPKNTTPVSNEGYDEDDPEGAKRRKDPANVRYYVELARRQGAATIAEGALAENWPEGILNNVPQMN